MNSTIATILVLLFHASTLSAQKSIQSVPKRPTSKTAVDGQVIRLSANSIFITVRDAEPNFVIENVNKSLDAKNLSLFLKAFYQNSKVKRTNDIVVRSKTKRLVAGESELIKMLDEIRVKHKINVVHMPPPTGGNPNAAIEEFARRHLR